MSAIAEPGMNRSTVAKSRGAGFVVLGRADRRRCIWLRWVLLFATEYGPFAITLSVLAWIF